MVGKASVSPGQCEYHTPVLIELIGDERYARCLLCGMIGPVRKTSEEARQALVMQQQEGRASSARRGGQRQLSMLSLLQAGEATC